MIHPYDVIRKKHLLRQVYRTDLLALCTEVLGYKDVSREVHGPIIDALQKFPGGEERPVRGQYRDSAEVRGARREGPGLKPDSFRDSPPAKAGGSHRAPLRGGNVGSDHASGDHARGEYACDDYVRSNHEHGEDDSSYGLVSEKKQGLKPDLVEGMVPPTKVGGFCHEGSYGEGENLTAKAGGFRQTPPRGDREEDSSGGFVSPNKANSLYRDDPAASLDAAEYAYRPFREIRALEGSRRLLVLYPRGHLKTTIVTIAHTIQWIINYPDVRILISTATGDQAQKIMREIRGHFQFNPYFRFLFPEFCPPDDKSADFGSRTEFTVPCRKLHRKEPTVWTCSVGKVIAGVHPDVIKNSDLVDKENVKTPGGINEVISHFRFLNPLLERYDGTDVTPASTGWNDVEGTRYDFGDLYGQLVKSPDWKTVVRAAYSADGDERGEPLWKNRFSKEELEKTRREMGEWEFAAQFLNKCIPVGDGLCDPRDVAFVPVEVIRGIMPTLRMHCTIDLSGMEDNRKGDWTVLTVGGFDRDGRLYILDVRCGRYSPEVVIEHIFDIHKRYPSVIDYKIEKEAHARVLLPFLQREMSKRQKFPVIYPIKRDTHTSKQHRIRGLRPWFKTGIIRFSQDIPLHVKQELLEEIAHFPSQSAGVHDDILDTLADMMQNSEGGVTDDVVPDPPDMKTAMFGVPRPPDRFLGFGEDGAAQWLYGDDTERKDSGRGVTGL